MPATCAAAYAMMRRLVQWILAVNTILAPVSAGELIDKIAILEIKAERIGQADRLANVRAELDALLPAWDRLRQRRPKLVALKTALKAVNARMWEIQDALREKEAAQEFDARFIELARSVYAANGERVGLKRRINHAAGSRLVEEKHYQGE